MKQNPSALTNQAFPYRLAKGLVMAKSIRAATANGRMKSESNQKRFPNSSVVQLVLLKGHAPKVPTNQIN